MAPTRKAASMSLKAVATPGVLDNDVLEKSAEEPKLLNVRDLSILILHNLVLILLVVVLVVQGGGKLLLVLLLLVRLFLFRLLLHHLLLLLLHRLLLHHDCLLGGRRRGLHAVVLTKVRVPRPELIFCFTFLTFESGGNL